MSSYSDREHERYMREQGIQEAFGDAVSNSRLGRRIRSVRVDEPQNTTHIWAEVQGDVVDDEEVIITSMTQQEMAIFDVIQRVRTAADIGKLLTMYEGGSGNLHIHALPAGVLDAYIHRQGVWNDPKTAWAAYRRTQ